MKRAQLIEWGIIVIALIFGYKFVESIITVLVQVIYGLTSPDLATEMIRMLVIIGLYATGFLVVIKNSHKLAVYLSGPDSQENNLPVKIGKRSLLQVILIAICAFAILTHLADIIYYIFEVFRNEVRTKSLLDLHEDYSGAPITYTITIKCIRVVIAIILIYASKNISDWLIRKDEADELVFDSKTEN